MTIALGSDHAGFRYKQRLAAWLRERGHEVHDLGPAGEAPVDYPVYIRPVALGVAQGTYDRGIVLGGSGNGEAMAANRVPGVRCALCWNVLTAELSRRHNNANLLSLGQRLLSLEQVFEIVQVWLETEFEGGRHQRRIELLDRAT